MLETLAKLVNADKLRIDYTEYELCDEFKEAMEHAQVSAPAVLLLVTRHTAAHSPHALRRHRRRHRCHIA
jgi:hypothetical protein